MYQACVAAGSAAAAVAIADFCYSIAAALLTAVPRLVRLRLWRTLRTSIVKCDSSVGDSTRDRHIQAAGISALQPPLAR